MDIKDNLWENYPDQTNILINIYDYHFRTKSDKEKYRKVQILKGTIIDFKQKIEIVGELTRPIRRVDKGKQERGQSERFVLSIEKDSSRKRHKISDYESLEWLSYNYIRQKGLRSWNW